MAGLSNSYHGKERVRVAKIKRGPDGVDEIVELMVRIELQGGTDASFTEGDNSSVVATDTCKNHVYMLAKEHSCSPPESFAQDLGLGFLRQYDHVHSVTIRVEKIPWKRFVSTNESPHNHGFVKDSTCQRFAECSITRSDGGTAPKLSIVSAMEGLEILKTTQSGWANFHDDRYRTLADTSNRILATRVNASWSYTVGASVDYDGIHTAVCRAMLDEFFGPASEGRFSPGVQHSLYRMGCAVIDAVSIIDSVTLSLPNLHFLPCQIPVFAKNDVTFDDDVYIPTDEPHGIISATVSRENRRSKL